MDEEGPVMRDDFVPPARSSFDAEMASAMNDVTLPVDLQGRLQAAVSNDGGLGRAVASRLEGRHWSRRLVLWASATTVLVIGAIWLAGTRLTLTESDVLQIAELDWEHLEPASHAAKFDLPSGWSSIPGVELAKRPLSIPVDSSTVMGLPLTVRSRKQATPVTGLLFSLSARHWLPSVESTSLAQSEVRYSASGTWAAWREGNTVYICVLKADARKFESLQRATMKNRQVL